MPTRKTTPKSEQARQRILDAAVRLFAVNGYERTTMRQIAAEAGGSLGLTYRYFTNKEDLVIALYGVLAADYARLAGGLPPTTLAQQFHVAMGLKLKVLEPHRDVLSSVFMSALQPTSGVFVFGEQSGNVRDVVMGAWRFLVDTSTDAPDPELREDVVMGLFITQLAIIFYWMHDRSPGRTATMQLVAMAAGALQVAISASSVPEVRAQLQMLSALLRPVFAPAGKRAKAGA